MYQFNGITKAKMPRASKRGRKSQAESGASSGRGRKTRASAMTDLMQPSPAYGAQAPGPDHNASAAYARTEASNAQRMMQHPQMSAPYQISQIQAPPNVPERPNSRYYTRAQTNERVNPYVRLDQNQNISHAAANQILYPNIVPRSTPTYSVPEQLPQLTAATEHAVAPRYNTRSAVHNLPLAAAPTMDRYWGSATSTRVPVTMHSGAVPQMTNTSPAACPLPIQTKDQAIQPEFTLTDEEVKLLKTLRSKRIEIARINIIIENDDYIVTYNEDTRERSPISRENYNILVKSSDTIKNALSYYYAGSPNPVNDNGININMRAIEYNDPQTNTSASNTESSPNRETTEIPTLLPCAQPNLQDLLNQMQVTPEEAGEPTHANNGLLRDAANTMPPTQTPRQNPTSPNQQTFPIPTLFNQRVFNNYARFMRHVQQNHRNPMGSRNGRFPGPNFNLPFNFLQNLPYSNMFINPPFLPHSVQDPDHFGMNGWQ